MKIKKGIATVLLTTILLSGCGNSSESISSTDVKESEIEIIEKNETVSLPVEIFRNEEYGKSSGKNIVFTRTIYDISTEDFTTESSEEFLNFYKKLRRENIDLVADYKLIRLQLNHKIEGDETRNKMREPFVLSEGSGLVIGNDFVAHFDDFVDYQQTFLSTDYQMGSTYEEEGEMLLAVKKEIANSDLQLKLNKQQGNSSQYVYIDLF